MYGRVLQSTSEPCSTCCGGIPCVMSMICASGAIRLITPWQVPTKSSWRPKSERNEMNTAMKLPRFAHCGNEAFEVGRRRLRLNSQPGGLGGGRRLRADGDDGNLASESRERTG